MDFFPIKIKKIKVQPNFQSFNQIMDYSSQKSLVKMFKIDRCTKYLPRYDEKTFLSELQHTENQLIQYFPQKFVDAHQNFKQTGYIIKAGFWVLDIGFVSFCHKIKLLSKIMGEKGWKMFIFKIAAIAFPLNFIDKIQQDAQSQFLKGLYQGVHKFYKRYKRTGDILDLNVKIFLQDKQTEVQRICRLNQFNLVHGLDRINEALKSKNVV